MAEPVKQGSGGVPSQDGLSLEQNATGTPSFARLAAVAKRMSDQSGMKRPLSAEKTNLTPPPNKAREDLAISIEDQQRLNKSVDLDETQESETVGNTTAGTVQVVDEDAEDEDDDIKEVGRVIGDLNLDSQQHQDSFPWELFVYIDTEVSDKKLLENDDWEAIVAETSDKMLAELEKDDKDDSKVEIDCQGQFIQHGVGRLLCKDEKSAKWYKEVISALCHQEKKFKALSRSEKGRSFRVTFSLRCPIGMSRERLERLIRAQNKFGTELFKITEESVELRTDHDSKIIRKSMRYHAIMSGTLMSKIRRKDGMYIKVQGRQPIRVNMAWSRTVRKQKEKLSQSYANVAARKPANDAIPKVGLPTKEKGRVQATKPGQERGKGFVDQKQAHKKWQARIPMTPLTFWGLKRQDRIEVKFAYREAKLAFPFNRRCPDEIFERLSENKRKAMKVSFGGAKTGPKPQKLQDKASSRSASSTTKKACLPSTSASVDEATASQASPGASSWAEQTEMCDNDAVVSKAESAGEPSKSPNAK